MIFPYHYFLSEEGANLAVYENYGSSQSYHPSTSGSQGGKRRQSFLSKVIENIKSVFTNVRRKYDTFSLQAVIRRVRKFFSVMNNRRYDNKFR